MQEFLPRAHQETIIDFLSKNKRCNVFAGMGWGKTVSVLTHIVNRKKEDPYMLPVLVVAPLRVVNSVWSQEATKWEHTSDLQIVRLTGTPKVRKEALETAADIYLINYELAPWLVRNLDGLKFSILVCDECSKLKGFRLKGGTVNSAACGKLALDTPEYIGLTGTPVANGLMGLWGIMWFVDQGYRLGRNISRYKDRWFYHTNNGYYTQYVPKDFALTQIKDFIQDVCLSIEGNSSFELDEPQIIDVPITLTGKALKIYKDFENKMFLELENGQVSASNAAVLSNKCIQIASGALYLDSTDKEYEEIHEEKLDALSEIIENSGGSHILVCCHYTFDFERVRSRFPAAVRLGTDEQTINDWNAGKIPLLLMHAQSAGHGLNLQHGGNIIVFYSTWWNLEHYQQAIERIGPARQKQSGYNRPVFIYRIVARDTVDEFVMHRLESKASVQELLLAALKRRVSA